MKKAISVLVVVLALVGLLFVNSIDFGYTEVAAYPIPNTPTATPLPTATPMPTPEPRTAPIKTPMWLPPNPPPDFIYFVNEQPAGAFNVVCCTCKSYTGGYNRLGTAINYQMNWGWGSYFQTLPGLFIGLYGSQNCPTYQAFPDWGIVYNSMLGGCVKFANVNGFVKNLTINDPSFQVFLIYPIYLDWPSFCIMVLPDVLRDSWH